jgi:hypothetical protein
MITVSDLNHYTTTVISNHHLLVLSVLPFQAGDVYFVRSIPMYFSPSSFVWIQCGAANDGVRTGTLQAVMREHYYLVPTHALSCPAC